MFFIFFASNNQLPGFYISGTLVEIGLMLTRSRLTKLGEGKLQNNYFEVVFGTVIGNINDEIIS